MNRNSPNLGIWHFVRTFLWFLTLESIQRSRVTKKVSAKNDGGYELMTTAIAIATTF
ncbi:MAG: hypothetical protein ACI9AV_001109 [Sediminicola sp.]|jgi:hypothetical protein